MAFGSFAPAQQAKMSRRLVIGLDGIPYGLFVKAQSQGLFKNFQAPSKMISTFPSLSQYAWARILQLGRTNAYQDYYFNSDINQRVEVISKSATYDGFPRTLDFINKNILEKGTAHIFGSNKILSGELDSIEQRILSNAKPQIFVAVISTTDSEIHDGGEKGVMPLLENADQKLRELQEKHLQKYGAPLEITVVSDHGNTLLPSEMPDIKGILEQNGFHMTNQIKNADDVVDVSVGLLSVASLYIKNDRKAELAHLMAQQHYTDLVTFFDDTESVFKVINQGGSISFEYDAQSNAFRITKVTGVDPLHLVSPAIEVGRWIDAQKMYEASLKTEYPNSLYRIYEGLSRAGVHYPASVCVSLKLGYEHGHMWTLNLGGKIDRHRSGTHGALAAVDSLGVIASTDGTFPEFVPANEVHQWIPQYDQTERYAPLSVLFNPNGSATWRVGRQLVENFKQAQLEVSVSTYNFSYNSFDTPKKEFLMAFENLKPNETQSYFDSPGENIFVPGKTVRMQMRLTNKSGKLLMPAQYVRVIPRPYTYYLSFFDR